MKFFTFSAIIGLVLLAGCGFHLRGITMAHLPFEEVTIQPAQPEDRFQQKLEAMLQAHGIPALKLEDSEWSLKLSPLELERSPLAYASNGELVREKVRLSMDYSLEHLDETVVTHQLSAERQHQLSTSAQLATQSEFSTIVEEMQTDLLQQMLLQLSRV